MAAHKISELEQKLMDASAPDRDRLQALRLLRRNGAMSDTVLQQALSWLQTATNNALREDIVQQLQGITNRAARAPLVKLATTDANPDVRQEAIQGLRNFVTDPQVESLLWELASKDTDGGVREAHLRGVRENPKPVYRESARSIVRSSDLPVDRRRRIGVVS